MDILQREMSMDEDKNLLNNIVMGDYFVDNFG
jgi:hypothetical protein